jgi:hypothetical protein|tara:strand:- start:572 stop:1039 length:468 start_codon:yes stop_codon:yes gene_type:complete
MNKIKTSRESQTREKQTRKKVWAPSSSLDAPPAPNGYEHRWIRMSVAGFEDTSNVSRKLREGWEFVRADTLLSEIGENDYPVISEGKHQGIVGIGGLALGRIPTEILKSRSEYFNRISQDRMEAVDRDLMKEQHPDMPINIERQSKVTFGGGRKS